MRIWAALAYQTARPLRATTRAAVSETAAGAKGQRRQVAHLPDQVRHHDQVAGVGGEDAVEEALQQRPLEEDLTVLGPEGDERSGGADPEDLEDGAQRQQGEQDQGEFATAQGRAAAARPRRVDRSSFRAAAPPPLACARSSRPR